MKVGGRTRHKKGFTIVETLIVLAVTGLLFASAVILISGRQNKTEFSTGSRQIQSRFQQVIDDIANGYYPSNNSLKCINAAGTPTVSNASTPEGTNDQCMFLGKAIQFGIKGSSPASSTPDQSSFQIYSVVGVRENSSGDLVTTIKEANPRLVNLAGLFETETMPYGMTIGWVKNNGTDIGAVGFLSSIGYIDAAGVAQGPSQQVDVYPIPGTHVGGDQATAVDNIENRSRKPGVGLINATPNQTTGVQVCVGSGGTDQHAVYTIGGQGRLVNVSFSVQNGSC